MADIGTTATALAITIAKLVYPKGLGHASATGRRTIIRRGWLTQKDATGNCSIFNGIDYVTVMPSGASYSEIPWPLGNFWTGYVKRNPTFTFMQLTDTSIQFIPIEEETVPRGICHFRMSLSSGKEICVCYVCQPEDSMEDIAAGVAANSQGTIIADKDTASINTEKVSTIESLDIGSSYTIERVLRRQTQMFDVSIWSALWQGRDKLGTIVDTSMGHTWWLPNLDSTLSQVNFHGAQEIDNQMTEGIYRRLLRFAITFDTIERKDVPIFAQSDVELNGRSITDVSDYESYDLTSEGNVYEKSKTPRKAA